MKEGNSNAEHHLILPIEKRSASYYHPPSLVQALPNALILLLATATHHSVRHNKVALPLHTHAPTHTLRALQHMGQI